MGFKLRLDMLDQAMGIVTVFFRNSAPAAEARQTVKSLTEQRDKNMKAVQEKMKLNQKEAKRFNPHASGEEEAIVRPLNIEGELYLGIPPDMVQTSTFLCS
ncbi:hypothetical protein ACFE04_011395 [Oxalis oulophora]